MKGHPNSKPCDLVIRLFFSTLNKTKVSIPYEPSKSNRTERPVAQCPVGMLIRQEREPGTSI